MAGAQHDKGPWRNPGGRGTEAGPYYNGDVVHRFGVFYQSTIDNNLSMPGADSNWTPLPAGGVSPPWNVFKSFLTQQPDLIIAGSWAWTGSTGVFLGGYSFNSTNAQNDGAAWHFDLSAGTWSFNIYVVKNTTWAINTIDYSTDGGATWIPLGTVDCYNAGGLSAYIQPFTGIVIANPGKVFIRFRALTRNGSATNWYIPVGGIQAVRTS